MSLPWLARVASLAALIPLAACATGADRAADVVLAAAPIASPDGKMAGDAQIVARTSGDVVLKIAVRGLPGAGTHGIHLHAVGRCEGPGFTSAGAHLNPFGRQHGFDNPSGSHLGDLPNIQVASDGTGTLERSLGLDGVAITAQLFDTDGTAVVLHATADDYRTDPSGNSGGRVACGVFARR